MVSKGGVPKGRIIPVYFTDGRVRDYPEACSRYLR